MNNLVLQPASSAASRRHYRDTVSSPIKIADVRELLSPYERQRLKASHPSGEFRCWGVTATPTIQRQWDRIDRGDVGFFSGSGKIYAKATITFKSHNEALARHLWGNNKSGKTWELMYFLSEVEDLEIPYSAFNAVLGYKLNNVIQGFMVLQGEKALKVLNHFDFWSTTYLPVVTREEMVEIIPSMEETEREATIKARKEQAYLRKSLFGDKVIDNCACCGKEFPVSMLVTAHIKKRRFCSHEERLDTNVVLPMCKFGCDELFENGYFTVSGSGELALNRKAETDFVKATLEKLIGRRVIGFHERNRGYFDWHREHHSHVFTGANTGAHKQ